MASISTENRSPNKTHRKTDRKSSRNAKKCPRANKAKTGMNTPPQNCPTKKGILFQGIQCQTLASHFYAPPSPKHTAPAGTQTLLQSAKALSEPKRPLNLEQQGTVDTCGMFDATKFLSEQQARYAEAVADPAAVNERDLVNRDSVGLLTKLHDAQRRFILKQSDKEEGHVVEVKTVESKPEDAVGAKVIKQEVKGTFNEATGAASPAKCTPRIETRQEVVPMPCSHLPTGSYFEVEYFQYPDGPYFCFFLCYPYSINGVCWINRQQWPCVLASSLV